VLSDLEAMVVDVEQLRDLVDGGCDLVVVYDFHFHAVIAKRASHGLQA